MSDKNNYDDYENTEGEEFKEEIKDEIKDELKDEIKDAVIEDDNQDNSNDNNYDKDDYDDYDDDFNPYSTSNDDDYSYSEDYDTDDYNSYDDSDNSDQEDGKSKLVRYALYFFIGLIAFLILIALLVSFGSKKSKEKIEQSLTLTTGENYTIKNASDPFSWTSSDNSIATVSTNGEIIAHKKGDAVVTITTDKEIITYTIHIDEAVIDVTNIKMEKDSLELKLDEEFQMNVNVYPIGASIDNLVWYSTNDKVAVVNNGIVKAVGIGTCIISVKTRNGVTDSILVKVSSNVTEEVVKVEDISFDTTSLVLKSGITYSLNHEITPKNATEKVIWESSDPLVATVEDGIIRTVKQGTITISAKVGSIVETCYVTVVLGDSDTPDIIDDGKTVYAESITLNQSEATLEEGAVYSLSAIVLPQETKDKSVSWSSSDETIVKVDKEGNLEALKEGFVVITASTSNGKTADCLINVTKKESQSEDYLTVELNPSNATMKVGETLQLTETIRPTNTLSDTIKWESSNPEVATVSNGVVTALKEGTTTITVILENGAKATSTITVGQKDQIRILSLKMNVSIINLKVNGSSQLSVSITPKNATDKKITWTTSNKEIVTVDNNGKVTAKKEGTAVITAKASNGIQTKCTVVVNNGNTKKARVEEEENKPLSILENGINMIHNIIDEVQNN